VVYCTSMVTKIYKGRRGHLFVAEWMADRGINDERLANRLGVARETVTRWRTQQHRLNPDKIAAIASALDLEPVELFRPPTGRPSLDALIEGLPAEQQDATVDIMKRLIASFPRG
jgi:transcriptional regulator with XRE-family HTH domain